MKQTETLEQFEQLVLAAVATMEGAYGTPIHAKVEELANRGRMHYGPVYSTLNRLENKGYVTSWIDEGPKGPGRPKRNYKIEPAGLRALKNSALTAERVIEATRSVLADVPEGVPNHATN